MRVSVNSIVFFWRVVDVVTYYNILTFIWDFEKPETASGSQGPPAAWLKQQHHSKHFLILTLRLQRLTLAQERLHGAAGAALAKALPAILVARQLLVISLRYHTPSVDTSSPNRLRRLSHS